MKFVRAVWKLLVGIKDALVLVFMLLFFGMLYAGLSAKPAPVRPGVLDVDLKGGVVEQPSRTEWSDVAAGSRTREYRLRDLVLALGQAKDDSRVKAVALDLDSFTGGGQTAMGDLADAIRQVRSAGKPVIAYATGYTNDSYQLAAAASEVWLNPLGAVVVTGPGSGQAVTLATLGFGDVRPSARRASSRQRRMKCSSRARCSAATSRPARPRPATLMR